MNNTTGKNPFHPLGQKPPLAFDTPRLHLRALRSDDDKLIFDLYAADPVATKYMSYKCTGKLSDTSSFVRGAAAYSAGETSPIKSLVWIIELKSSNEPIGSVGLGPKGEFGVSGGYILNKKWWGHGYASEAWCCIVDWAKMQPNVWRIEAMYHPDNTVSGKILEKSGMKFEGRLRRHMVFPNMGPDPEDAMMCAWAR